MRIIQILHGCAMSVSMCDQTKPPAASPGISAARAPAITTLEGKGLVHRLADEDDRRVSRVNSPKQGRKIHNEIAVFAHEREKKLLSRFKPEDQKEFERLLTLLDASVGGIARGRLRAEVISTTGFHNRMRIQPMSPTTMRQIANQRNPCWKRTAGIPARPVSAEKKAAIKPMTISATSLKARIL